MSTNEPASAGTPEPCPPIWQRRKNLKPREAAQYLAEVHGIDRSPSTLSKDRCRGDGPRFLKLGGGAVLYPVDELETWALARLGQPVASTSELPVKAGCANG